MKLAQHTSCTPIISAVLFALAVLFAPAWHATQASQPAECCDEQTIEMVVTEVADSCCCKTPTSQTSDEQPGEEDAPSPKSPCPSDGQCPCCKSLVIASAATLPTSVTHAINQDITLRVIAHLDRPDSRAVSIDIQPPIG